MTISGVVARSVRGTVLFADGDSNARFAYQSAATSWGFSVELARDGYEAITLANLMLPAAIVLDSWLAGHDGLEVAAKLRESPRTRAIPLVMVSSEDGIDFDAAVRGCGCDGHIVKPCSAEALMRLVTVLLIGGPFPGEVAPSVKRAVRRAGTSTRVG